MSMYRTADIAFIRVVGPVIGQHLNLITCEGTVLSD